MTTDINLHSKLTEASRRIRILRAMKWSMRMTMAVASIELVWLLCSRVNWIAEPKSPLLIISMLFTWLFGALIGATRPLTVRDAALLTDMRTDSKDRLASAVEFEGANADDPFMQQQVADANKHVRSLQIARAFPIKLTREAVATLVISLFLFLAFFLPTMPIFWSQEKKKEMEEVKKAGIMIEKIAVSRGKTADQQKLAETQKAAKEAQKLAEAMKKGGVNKKTAMVQLAKLTKQMEEAQKRLAQANNPGQKSLAKAGEEVKKSLENQQKAIEANVKAAEEKAKSDAAKNKAGMKPGDQKKQDDANSQTGKNEAQKQAEKNGKGQSEAMKQMQMAMQKFSQGLMDQNSQMQQQALQQMAEQMKNGQISPQEMGQMAQMMQQMANALRGTELSKAGQSLEEAAKAAKQMQIKFDPETLKKLQSMMSKASGQCKGGPMKMDAQQLAEFLQALKEGRIKLASGSGSGVPIPMPGKPGAGGKKGSGSNGQGFKGERLKNEVANSPKLTAVGKTGNVTADATTSKEFLKYAAMGHKDSKFTPNTQVKGVWNQSKSELQQQFLGDPEGEYVTGTPLYSASQSGLRSTESPVNKEQIPAAYRKQVRQYFESINGNGK